MRQARARDRARSETCLSAHILAKALEGDSAECAAHVVQRETREDGESGAKASCASCWQVLPV